MPKFWRFINKAATETEPEDIELRIEGDIIPDDDIWIYELFKVEYAAKNEFKEELQQYDGKNITVWIDSFGGDVFAANGIYNALKEHNGQITIKVEKAMSAATIIMMAANTDQIYVAPGSITMVHDPLVGICGWFQAKDLQYFVDYLSEVSESIMNAYELRTKRSRDDLKALMEAETHMSAKRAIKEGFADHMLYEDEQKTKPEDIRNWAFSRMAIVNSANKSAQKFYDLKDIIMPGKKPTEADIKSAKAKLDLQLQLI